VVRQSAITLGTFDQLNLGHTLFVEQVVQGEDPQAQARRRNQRVDAGERSARGDRQRQRPDAHTTDEWVARGPAMEGLRGTCAQVEDAYLLSRVERSQIAAAQAAPWRILGSCGLRVKLAARSIALRREWHW